MVVVQRKSTSSDTIGYHHQTFRGRSIERRGAFSSWLYRCCRFPWCECCGRATRTADHNRHQGATKEDEIRGVEEELSSSSSARHRRSRRPTTSDIRRTLSSSYPLSFISGLSHSSSLGMTDEWMTMMIHFGIYLAQIEIASWRRERHLWLKLLDRYNTQPSEASKQSELCFRQTPQLQIKFLFSLESSKSELGCLL